MTKWQLMNAFLNGQPLTIPGNFPARQPVLFTVINKIEREDGSNHSYNVTGQTKVGDVDGKTTIKHLGA